MSNDEVRWCDNEKKNDRIDSTTSNNVNASYTFLSVYHINNNNIVHDDDSNKDDDQINVINIHKHRNIHIKRDSRNNYNFYDDYDNSTDSTTRSTCQYHHSHQQHDHHQKHSSTYSRKYYQIVNVCLIVMLHVLCNFLVTSVNCDELMDSVGARGHFTHTWAVHIPGGENVAKLVADDHGMIFRGRIIDDHYHMEHRSIAKRSISPSHHHQRRLNEDNRVVWSKQQTAKSRQKRDFTRLKPKSVSKLLNDPKWSSMWYLNRGDGLDMNVVPAWREGITGKGVVVTILDDGLETDHPDLERNYDPEASWDVNSHDADPMPHYDMTDSNRHGTRCAGEVAATANNSLCAVGIAYSARVGGVRMLDGDVTDSVEAMSLGLNPQHIDIYSASWGPDDDGKTVDGPGEMATKAFIDGVTKGRAGKGSIFVWASGNGGREQDNCNCDGYTNSIWTLSISSATEYGDIPWYSEKCSSTLATTYSSGQQNEKQVVTTDLHHMCTSSHTGTSASAPLAAGIVALALEANPNLTWRDMQHIVVRTANPANLGKSSNEWTVNGVGRKVSHSFGYGLMDAAAMVRLARVWETVPEQQRCEIHSPHLDKPIPPKRNVTFALKVDHCKGVNFLEHIQARITLTTQRRGDIVIYLTSPSGTRTCLLTERVHDISRSGFGDWPFMTVHQWGEAPHGTWELEIHNKGRYMEFALLRYWTLVLYGTAISAQRGDDEVSQSSSNSQLLNSNTSLNNSNNSSTNYRSKPQNNNSNNNNNSGSTANRKTSSQQKSSTLSPQATTITRKNGKQKNSNKNGKSNQKITSSTTTTTVRPLYTTVMLNQFSISTQMGKNKTKVNQNASTIVPRPRPTAKLPNTKSNSNANNNNNNNNNNLLSSSKLDKYQPSYSNIYEKSSGKGPKQVKENSYTTPRLSEGPTQNPSMSRMFEQYEKIEEIFPEFEPYKEVNPVFFTVSNGKPSRENSKSFSSFVSFDSVPQKKNTPIDDPSETRQKIISSPASSTQGASNGKGTIF
ncbi:hypothetical protein ACKWTF_010956 [Chironomus riparius]